MIHHDVVVVGGGLAGLRAAVGLCDKYDVALVSKVHPIRSHSIAAQGGINAALANNPDGRDDTWEKHAFDTIKGSDYLADQDAVEIMCREAINVVYEMEHWGCPFSRFPDGTIAQRPFGGAGYPRTCYSADLTGHVLLNTLYERAVACGVRIYSEYVVAALAAEEGVCHGVVLIDQVKGTIVPVLSRATLFATGGYGRIYYHSTNAVINNGSGIGMAYAAGVPMKDMEFVQFHPTTLLGTNILMSEACRGEGAYLINNKGERFMERYVPKAMELAPGISSRGASRARSKPATPLRTSWASTSTSTSAISGRRRSWRGSPAYGAYPSTLPASTPSVNPSPSCRASTIPWEASTRTPGARQG